MHVSVRACHIVLRGQKRRWGPLEVELQEVVGADWSPLKEQPVFVCVYITRCLSHLFLNVGDTFKLFL